VDCPTCQSENRPGASFCDSCGSRLARACASCGQELRAEARFCDGCGTQVEAAAPRTEPDPSSYTPKHLAEKILTQRAALEGERKQVTVLFADVKGSMDLADRLGPEDWHEILDRFFQILTEGVHRFEGTVNQYTGDGIMALFGAPIAHEDHAQRACYAALHLREELETHARELKRERGLIFSVRMGLNSGDVVVGKIGDDLRMDYTAQGHTVGLAQRMEQLAGPEKIYVAEATQKLAEGYVDLEDLGEFRVEGVREPVSVFELKGRGAQRTRFDVSVARGLTRFVGRGAEMRRLDEALERSLAGEAQIVALVADAGVGKSRLCFEFGQRCQARGIPVRTGRGVAHGASVPFLPIMEYLRDVMDIREEDSDQRARQKIAGSVVLLEDALTDALPLVFDFMGVPDPERPPPPLEPDVRQRQLLEIQRRLHRARSERNPAVILLEDLHWFDAGSLQHLEDLVRVIQGTRTLLLLNFRPEFKAPWMGASFYQQLALRPLSTEEVGELLRELLGADPALDELRGRILERTGGNPYYAEEVVRSLAEVGTLEGTRGAYRLTGPVSELAIPATVQSVLASRIDRLAEREKRLVQTAAVIGGEFSESLMRAVAEVPDRDLADGLRRLVEAELILEEALYPEALYAFRHPLSREVAYESQLGSRRAAVHRAVASALEGASPERLDELSALLAHHWEHGGDALRAASWGRRAAEKFVWSDPQGALAHWRNVRALVEGLGDAPEARELDLAACLGVLFQARTSGIDQDEGSHVFEDGARLAREAGDVRALARLNAWYGMLHAPWGDLEGWARFTGEGAKLAEALDDPLVRFEAAAEFSLSALITESAHRSLEALDGALAGGGDPGALEVGSEEHFAWLSLQRLRGLTLAYLARYDEAGAELESTLEAALDAGYVSMVQRVHEALSVLAHRQGDVERTLHHGRKTLELGERMDSPGMLVAGHMLIGRGLLLAGDFAQAIEELDLARALAHEHTTGLARETNIIGRLVEAHLGLGDVERAAELFGELERRTSGPALGAAARLVEAQVLSASRGLDAADEIARALDRAAEGIEASGWHMLAPELARERAALAALRGDEEGRLAHLRDALRICTETGAAGHAERFERDLAD
jgi:class 3 adenylate cyclase/tetratricopeptide (TPR) repeat protein